MKCRYRVLSHLQDLAPLTCVGDLVPGDGQPTEQVVGLIEVSLCGRHKQLSTAKALHVNTLRLPSWEIVTIKRKAKEAQQAEEVEERQHGRSLPPACPRRARCPAGLAAAPAASQSSAAPTATPEPPASPCGWPAARSAPTLKQLTASMDSSAGQHGWGVLQYCLVHAEILWTNSSQQQTLPGCLLSRARNAAWRLSSASTCCPSSAAEDVVCRSLLAEGQGLNMSKCNTDSSSLFGSKPDETSFMHVVLLARCSRCPASRL